MTQDVDKDRIANATTEIDDGDCEIEITQEMIEAGVPELCAYDYRYESEEEAVVRIFTAMALASKSPKASHL